jgi:glycosyltransferase involved in cell wall biosynthesis
MNASDLLPETSSREVPADGRLTIVLPTYNHGHFIAEAIDSLYAQSRKPDRIIVLDDASTDNTADVIKQYGNQVPGIEFIRGSQNRGVIAMLNRGLSLADTEFVSFLAADDFVRPNLYAKSLSILSQYPKAAVCGVHTSLIAEDGAPLPRIQEPNFGPRSRYFAPAEAVAQLHRLGGLFGGNGAVYRTAMLRGAGGFAADLLSFCDGYAVQILAARHGVCVVPETLAVWRQRATSFAAQSRVDAAACRSILRAVEARRDEETEDLPAAYRHRLESRLRFAAVTAAVCEPEINRSVLTDVLSDTSGIWIRVLALAKMLGGRPLVEMILGIRFRPFDVFPTLWRRVWTTPRN